MNHSHKMEWTMAFFFFCNVSWDIILAPWVENNKPNLSWKILTSIFPQVWKHLTWVSHFCYKCEHKDRSSLCNLPSVELIFLKQIYHFTRPKEHSKKTKRQTLWSNEFLQEGCNVSFWGEGPSCTLNLQPVCHTQHCLWTCAYDFPSQFLNVP